MSDTGVSGWRDGLFTVSGMLIVLTAIGGAAQDMLMWGQPHRHVTLAINVFYLTFLLALFGLVFACFGKNWRRVLFVAAALIELWRFRQFVIG